MANLDSFFAKKDKKKKGKRFSGTSTTAMAKALEVSVNYVSFSAHLRSSTCLRCVWGVPGHTFRVVALYCDTDAQNGGFVPCG